MRTDKLTVWLFGRSVQRQAEIQRIGKEKLEALIRETGVLIRANQAADPAALGKELASAIKKIPESKQVIIAVTKESDEIERRATNVLSPRDSIILSARDALATQAGMDRRQFLRTMGLAAAALGEKAAVPSWIYSPSIPQFSRDKIIQRIATEAVRSVEIYVDSLSGRIMDQFPTLAADFVASTRSFIYRDDFITLIRNDGHRLIYPGMTEKEIKAITADYSGMGLEFLECNKYFDRVSYALDGFPGAANELVDPHEVRDFYRYFGRANLSRYENAYWPHPWLGIKEETAVFQLGYKWSTDDMDYNYSLPWEVNLL